MFQCGKQILHILTHTAGIPSFTSFPEYPKFRPFPHTPEQLVALFRDKPLEFTPGERMVYSNSGYVLLGYLIEKVSGETYQDFLQKNIFNPLGMTDSGYDSNSAIIPRRAAGYTSGPKGPVNADFEHMSIPFSAGALYSTTEDLLRWQQGIFGGELLSAESVTKMTTPFKNGYALGVGVNTINGREQISHGGGISGFNTFLSYFPEEKLTIAVLANLNGNAPQAIAGLLADVAFGEKVVLQSERKEIAVSPIILKQYVGTYQLAPKFNLMITLEGEELMAQASGQTKLPLFASSETEFFYKVVDAQMDFIKDDKGEVTGLTLHQNGRDINGTRISDTVAVRKKITVSPKILSRYVGTYELGPGFDLAVTLEGNQLMTQATGQGKIPIFAESETKFFPKVMDAEIEFLINDKGEVTHLILHQGPTEIRAPRK